MTPDLDDRCSICGQTWVSPHGHTGAHGARIRQAADPERLSGDVHRWCFFTKHARPWIFGRALRVTCTRCGKRFAVYALGVDGLNENGLCTRCRNEENDSSEEAGDWLRNYRAKEAEREQQKKRYMAIAKADAEKARHDPEHQRAIEAEREENLKQLRAKVREEEVFERLAPWIVLGTGLYMLTATWALGRLIGLASCFLAAYLFFCREP